MSIILSGSGDSMFFSKKVTNMEIRSLVSLENMAVDAGYSSVLNLLDTKTPILCEDYIVQDRYADTVLFRKTLYGGSVAEATDFYDPRCTVSTSEAVSNAHLNFTRPIAQTKSYADFSIQLTYTDTGNSSMRFQNVGFGDAADNVGSDMAQFVNSSGVWTIRTGHYGGTEEEVAIFDLLGRQITHTDHLAIRLYNNHDATDYWDKIEYYCNGVKIHTVTSDTYLNYLDSSLYAVCSVNSLDTSTVVNILQFRNYRLRWY